MSDDVKVNEEVRMKAVDQTDLDPEVCCGLILSQIWRDWEFCPYCGGALEHWVLAKKAGEWR